MTILKKWIDDEKIFVKTRYNNKNQFWVYNDNLEVFQEIQYTNFETWSYKKTGNEISHYDKDYDLMNKSIKNLYMILQCDATENDIY